MRFRHHCDSACEEPHEQYIHEMEHPPESCQCEECHANHKPEVDYTFCEHCQFIMEQEVEDNDNSGA